MFAGQATLRPAQRPFVRGRSRRFFSRTSRSPKPSRCRRTRRALKPTVAVRAGAGHPRRSLPRQRHGRPRDPLHAAAARSVEPQVHDGRRRRVRRRHRQPVRAPPSTRATRPSAPTPATRAAAPSASWALDNIERQLNFGHVAIHRVAEVSKAIIRAHYNAAPSRSYFNGCSNGGRQALMEAQRYPDDFDGIVAGAPAYDFTGIGRAVHQGHPGRVSRQGEPVEAAVLRRRR